MATLFALLPSRNESLDREAEVARLAVMLPTMIAAAMVIIGYSIANIAGVDGTPLFYSYIKAGCVMTIICVLFYIFVSFAKLAFRLADNPISVVRDDVQSKAPFILLSAFVFPIFLCGFTTAKTSIPYVVGFRWDAFWADVDLLIFGDDAWRISHNLLGTAGIRIWEWLYGTIWGLILVLFKVNVPLYAKPRRIGIIYTAMLLTWLVGGWLLAYSMSAAGPVFAHLFDPELTQRFALLRSALAESLGPESPTRFTQNYLAFASDIPIAYKGGGISAMPSMHIGAASIYVLAARGTYWLLPAIAFWIFIFIGSGYFGYHYWVDGIVAAAVAWGCWTFAEYCFRRQGRDVPAFAAADDRRNP